MPEEMRVKVTVRCRSCGHQQPGWCVRVERGIPPQLRCPPATGGGGGGVFAVVCPRCGRDCGLSIPELERRVADELRGQGIDDHIKRGAVLIEC